jgi:hypothetical protein
MSDSTNKQPTQNPRVLVRSFNRDDRGYFLTRAQTIRAALKELSDLPSIGLVCPWIPGKAPNEVQPGDDISTIGIHHGVIATTTASIPKSALEVVLLVGEKLKIFQIASETSPGLFTKVLGIRKQKFNYISKKLRQCRNWLAHPDPEMVIEGSLDFTGIPEEIRRYAKLLVEWNVSPYMSACEGTP